MPNTDRLLQVRAAFSASGVSVADWARQNRFSTPLVYAVLQGRNQATRGESHRIAVALGIKDAYTGPLPPGRTTFEAAGTGNDDGFHTEEGAHMKA
jgi:gp16 family phage-associated protein